MKFLTQIKAFLPMVMLKSTTDAIQILEKYPSVCTAQHEEPPKQESQKQETPLQDVQKQEIQTLHPEIFKQITSAPKEKMKILLHEATEITSMVYNNIVEVSKSSATIVPNKSPGSLKVVVAVNSGNQETLLKALILGGYEDFTKIIQFNYTLPVIVGVAAVLFAIKLSKYWFPKKKKQTITLVDSNATVPLKLVEKIDISHDTKKFRFALPSENHVLGLPFGQHIFLSATINDEPIIRSYTPVTSDKDIGYMDLVIKVYPKDVHPKFPAGGKMSQHLNNMKIGEYIDVRGPSGKLKYLGGGRFSLKSLSKGPPRIVTVEKVAMIAGGTGITPMLQLIRYINKDMHDITQMALLFANKTEKDILFREELEEDALRHYTQFKLWYTVDTPSEGWKYSTGFVNADMIQSHLFPPAPDTLVLMCGPPPMVDFACIPNLDKLGYDPNLCFAY